MDRGAWQAMVHGIPGVGHDLTIRERGKYAYPHLRFFLQLSFSLLSWGADYFSFVWEGREIITVEFKGSENSLDIYNSYPFKNSFYSCLGWFKPHHIRFSW